MLAKITARIRFFGNSGKFKNKNLLNWVHRQPFRQRLAGIFGNSKLLAFHCHRSKVVYIFRKILAHEKSEKKKKRKKKTTCEVFATANKRRAKVHGLNPKNGVDIRLGYIPGFFVHQPALWYYPGYGFMI